MQNYKNIKVDLSNCDNEPIHIIGRIQPHGFMIILDRLTSEVIQVSENIGNFLKINPSDLPGKPISALTTPEEHKLLMKQLTEQATVSPQIIQLQEKQFFGFIHESEKNLVLEFEPMEYTASEKRLQSTLSFSQFHSELNMLSCFEDQTNLLVSYIQRTLEYDRVMLYVFDQDWHGEVIAEKTRPGIHSYLHHHFPSTDIPAQARDLLLKKCVRQIVNVQATAVDIIPYFNPKTNAPTNIILSELRNPSEIHLEYLKNMEVGATLSVSIIVQGKLWGIIACHHQSARFINFWKRQICHVAALTFSNAVLANQEKVDQQVMDLYRQAEKQLIHQISTTADVANGLFHNSHNLLSLTEGHGAAMFLEGQWSTLGQTPEESQLMEIISWLCEESFEQVKATRQLSENLPAASVYQKVASGLLAIELSRYNKEFILFFKPEIKETRIWAGNPEKPLPGTDARIHPRESFQNWEEIIQGKSHPWSLNEITIAQVLQKDLLALLMKKQAARLKELNEELNESGRELQLKNKKLEDFAQIIAHNLRSPLSNIRGLFALYRAEPSQETSEEVMARMSRMIDNMSSTIDDLNLVLRSAIKQDTPQELVQISDLIDKEKENLQASLLATDAIIETDLKVKELFVPKVYLESILHNLLSNALKYSAEDRKPFVRISSWAQDHSICLAVSDNGLGINLEKVGSKLYGLYNTFHNNKDSKGIGLYLTKTQVELIGGKIEVKSEVNQGTTFTITFPKSVSKE
ncbi:ATP-binding protein [Pontibacter locisalis]|uniref:histidine kinase n=1 Tax=Pontibacter locisalis TaxID=1719035 RepID=A0ABW5IPT0_9BACT